MLTATSLFRYNGEAAIGLTIGMKAGANLLQFGDALKTEMSRIVTDLPIGVDVNLVSDQPLVVDHAYQVSRVLCSRPSSSCWRSAS